jgi:hypothetical protein
MIKVVVNKKELSEMVHQLSEKDLPLVSEFLIRLLEHPKDSNIPYDDEPLTNDDIQAIEQSKKEFQTGYSIKLKDIEHDLRN